MCEINLAHFSVSRKSHTSIKIYKPTNIIKIIGNMGIANIGSAIKKYKKSLHHIDEFW